VFRSAVSILFWQAGQVIPPIANSTVFIFKVYHTLDIFV
jgi:hypothetical protein